jgi:lipoprotein-anchoring transpeptidase ErfK/SrfK
MIGVLNNMIDFTVHTVPGRRVALRHGLAAALAAVTLAAAGPASADPLSALFGGLFGQAPAQRASYQPAATSYQPSADYYQPGATAAYAYAPSGSQSGAVRIPRQVVAYDGPYAAGTVVISTSERRLYLVLPGQRALKYGIGVGREGFEWAGAQTITRKQEWPDWRPPAQMLQRRPDLPRYMEGGPENPLGARAMYLGSSLYRIHGSNEPDTIGTAVSSGCIRMLNDDVVDLYDRVKVGTRVVVLR